MAEICRIWLKKGTFLAERVTLIQEKSFGAVYYNENHKYHNENTVYHNEKEGYGTLDSVRERV